MSSYDCVIIGAGPAGYTAAIRAAQLGKRAIIIERGGLGGACLNRGCIPTKAYVASACLLKHFRRAQEFGIDLDATPRINFSAVQERKRSITATLRKGIDQLLASYGIEVVHGIATFTAPHELKVGDRIFTAPRIIVATGSEWIEIAHLKPDGNYIVNSDHAMAWNELPRSVLIVGGGYIGCEFASFMNLMGVEVTIVEATEGLLPNVDRQLSRMLQREFVRNGMRIVTGTSVEETKVQDGQVITTLASGETHTTHRVLIAVGRKPASSKLNLEAIGVALGRLGEIFVDERFETNVKGVYAIGDVNGQIMLAHAASEQGISCIDTMFGGTAQYDGRFVPSCIFSDPEIGYVGQSAQQLEREGIAYRTGAFPFAALGKAFVDGQTQGQVVVYTDTNDKLLGVHVIGDNATGIVAEATVALKQGMTARELAAVIHAHPTVSEGLAEAARDVDGWAIHKRGKTRH